MSKRLPTKLIATVGSNPLPVLIVARYQRWSKLVLLHTKTTANIADRIFRLLTGDPSLPEWAGVAPEYTEGDIKRHSIGEGQSLNTLVEDLNKVDIPWKGSCLNYTAGTKQMSVAVHQLWRTHNSEPPIGVGACYLSSSGRLYWDSGDREEMAIHFSIQEMAWLHFGEASTSSGAHRDAKMLGVAQKIANHVAHEGLKSHLARLPACYGNEFFLASRGRNKPEEMKFVGQYNAANEKNYDSDSFWVTDDYRELAQLLGFSSNGVVHWDHFVAEFFPKMKAKEQKKRRLDTFKFLAAEWLEVWLAAYLESTGLFTEVVQSFKVGSGTKEFELDVVALRGSRIFCFSCTSDDTTALVKSKALEAHHRTQRIGGEHAAFAVFSLHKEPEKVLDTIRDERWPGHERVRIFGIEHLKDDGSRLGEELIRWIQP